MEAPRTDEEYSQRIEAIRLASQKRRAEAWAMVPETVLGLELVPLTPARYSILRGIGNAYLTGRVPGEADLRNFIWFCSPKFNPDSPLASLRWKPMVLWQLNRMLGCYSFLVRRDEIVMQNFYRACLQIHEIVDSTFRDSPPNGEDGQPLAASYEAQVINLFAQEYQMWPLPQPIRHTPIKQLNQLARCIDRYNGGKEDTYYDREEHNLTMDYLGTANARN